jgi:SET domain-containing protein
MPARIVTRRSAIHGNGMFAATDIPAGTRLIQYKGKLLTQAESDELYGDGADTGHTFLFSLNDDYVIDANQQGNSARWINHGCAPNCEAVVDEDAGGDRRRDRVFIESIRDIRKGEELTYNYGIVLGVAHTRAMKRIWACRCGAPQCTGTMLQPKRGRR